MTELSFVRGAIFDYPPLLFTIEEILLVKQLTANFAQNINQQNDNECSKNNA
jgi:hypothetical protein